MGIFKCMVCVSRPNKEKVVELSLIDLKWVSKEDKLQQLNQKLSQLGDFLECVEVEID